MSLQFFFNVIHCMFISNFDMFLNKLPGLSVFSNTL